MRNSLIIIVLGAGSRRYLIGIDKLYKPVLPTWIIFRNGQDARATFLGNGQDARATFLGNGQDARATFFGNGQDARATRDRVYCGVGILPAAK
jgi:hypothetical protein